MDKNLFGKCTSTDPYIEVGVSQGATRWAQLLLLGSLSTQNDGEKGKICTSMNGKVSYEANKTIKCRIFDHEKMSADNFMGTIFTPLHTKVSKRYPVGKQNTL
jgi:hypothetical protein